MKENKLTKKALKQLAEYDIKESDVLSVCPLDLSFGSNYLTGYIFLTKKNVGLCTIETPLE